MKKCPCCDKNSLDDEDVMNSISHIDNRTYICNDCGKKESLLTLSPDMCDKIDLEIYIRFKERLGKS